MLVNPGELLNLVRVLLGVEIPVCLEGLAAQLAWKKVVSARNNRRRRRREPAIQKQQSPGITLFVKLGFHRQAKNDLEMD